MSVNTANNGLKSILSILFGSPDLPPLGRKAFIREALLVFLVRWVLVELLGVLFFRLIGIDYGADLAAWWQVFISILIACIFLIPYIRVIHRRLLGIGFPFPRVLVCLATTCIFIFAYFLPDEFQWHWYIANIIFYVGMYLLLIPWGDHAPHKADNSNIKL